jgi:murein DD-endopeptidase MepM/ murein hydrolase activator NlpD
MLDMLLGIGIAAPTTTPYADVVKTSPIQLIREFYLRNPQLTPVSKLDLPIRQVNNQEQVESVSPVITTTQVSYVATNQLDIPLPAGTYIESAPYGQWRGSYAHTGVDLAAPTGTPVLASDAGVVSYTGWAGGYGYLIIIDHGNDRESYYAHLSSIGTQVGTKIPKGRAIGWVGSTGRSTGPHLHWEYRINGEPVDPWDYVK